MKTAISIPDKVFESAEKLAKHRGQSRSQLYTKAISSYVENHKSENVTQKLDEIYGQTTIPIDQTLQTLQFRSLTKDRW
jgi:metal-responsive CopG/Arc/MetJ family transcriptional regulator